MNGHRAAECTYESRSRLHPTTSRTLSISNDRPPGPPSVPGISRTSADARSVPLTSPSDPAPPTWSDSSETSSLPPSPDPHERPSTLTVQHLWELSPCIYDQLAPCVSSGVAIKQKVHDTTKCDPRNVTSFTLLPSIHFQTIPRPLRIPLSLIPPERLQVSGDDGSDLGLSLCVLSLGEQIYAGSHELTLDSSAA